MRKLTDLAILTVVAMLAAAAWVSAANAADEGGSLAGAWVEQAFCKGAWVERIVVFETTQDPNAYSGFSKVKNDSPGGFVIDRYAYAADGFTLVRPSGGVNRARASRFREVEFGVLEGDVTGTACSVDRIVKIQSTASAQQDATLQSYYTLRPPPAAPLAPAPVPRQVTLAPPVRHAVSEAPRPPPPPPPTAPAAPRPTGPPVSAALRAALEEAVAKDSQGWHFNQYDAGSIRNVVVLSASKDGKKRIRGEYTYNTTSYQAGFTGSVEAEVIGNSIDCLQFSDRTYCAAVYEKKLKCGMTTGDFDPGTSPTTGGYERVWRCE